MVLNSPRSALPPGAGAAGPVDLGLGLGTDVVTGGGAAGVVLTVSVVAGGVLDWLVSLAVGAG